MMNLAVLTLSVSTLFCSPYSLCIAVMYFGIVYSDHILLECSVDQKVRINCTVLIVLNNCIFKTKVFNNT